ncbi:hypothetical protein EYF80_002177 [Liparis tanakae]|uniref:Uncharacterized protein n=1 Tax=Liparis tanakae TaxID=230148 RepID=A0A4Z2JBE6_9TELE|nr:hypothetical protein EYF80_002177 [Liparis tanakae]
MQSRPQPEPCRAAEAQRQPRGRRGSSLTEQKQLDVLGGDHPVLLQVPLDGLAPVQSSALLGAQRTSHVSRRVSNPVFSPGGAGGDDDCERRRFHRMCSRRRGAREDAERSRAARDSPNAENLAYNIFRQAGEFAVLQCFDQPAQLGCSALCLDEATEQLIGLLIQPFPLILVGQVVYVQTLQSPAALPQGPPDMLPLTAHSVRKALDISRVAGDGTLFLYDGGRLRGGATGLSLQLLLQVINLLIAQALRLKPNDKVHTQIQDVCAGLELSFHCELLGESKKPTGVLREGLAHRSRAVALQELLTRRHILKLHLHPQEGVGVMDLKYLITAQASCRI